LHERYPAWSPDGSSIAYFSDEGGEYALHIADASGSGSVTRLPPEEPGFFYDPVWAPDSQKVAYTDKRRSLWYVDISSKTHRKIGGNIGPDDAYVWSPDSQWVAYASRPSTLMRRLKLYSLESGESYRITDPMGDANSPTFSRDGRYLYFLGSTSSGQLKTGLDLSVVALQDQVTWEVFSVVLQKGYPSPFAPSMPTVTSTEESSPAATFRIDLDGMDQRIVRLPVPPGRYANIQAASENALFFLEKLIEETPNGGFKLHRFDMKEKQSADFLDSVQDYKVSADGQWILYQTDKEWSIVPTTEKPDPASGRLDRSGMRINVDPKAEWRQMFVEAWRKNRDFFYDEALHGIDWNAMRLRYEAYLPDLRHRSDLNWLIRKLLSELVNSHVFVSGGDIPKVQSVPVGLLGVDYEVVEGRYRIKTILATSSWDKDDERSPFSTPGLGVQEGDFILEVNGRELAYPTNIYSLFTDTAEKNVVLRVNSEPRMEGSREIIVVPLKNERALRRRAWIEHNRKVVDKLSQGAIAYVYQPDTGTDSIREFNRYFFPQSDRQAVIIDERFNDGGDDPDYQLDILDRQQLHWYVRRNTPPFTSPYSMISGPKVMIVNAEAGSGGDVYPYQFKLRGLGVTVGTRTWGGVMGGGGGPLLLDGGYVSAPNLGTYSAEGDYILENSGHRPDHEVAIYPQDDFRARDPQLEKAVEILLERLKVDPPKDIPDFKRVDRSLKPKEP
jgi:tricorn protease